MTLGHDFPKTLAAAKTGAEWAWAAIYRDLASSVTMYLAARGAAAVVPSDDAAVRFARQAALATRPATRPATHTEAPVRTRSAVSAPRPRSYARFAGAFATLVVMLSASAGVAYAADASAPGYPLHGLDLAMESMGIGNGGLSERLSEAGGRCGRPVWECCFRLCSGQCSRQASLLGCHRLGWQRIRPGGL